MITHNKLYIICEHVNWRFLINNKTSQVSYIGLIVLSEVLLEELYFELLCHDILHTISDHLYLQLTFNIAKVLLEFK